MFSKKRYVLWQQVDIKLKDAIPTVTKALFFSRRLNDLHIYTF